MANDSVTLPERVNRVLAGFVETVKGALGSDLKSVVLYGSAAEGRLRETSDVNLIVVLGAFEVTRMDGIREALRTAYAAIRLQVMFLLDDEVPAAVEAFAVKFADVLHRRHVLYGPDPFETLKPSRDAEIARLKQVLLNLVLRLRQKYLLHSLRDEQVAALVADTAGPIRTCAEALLELQGKPATSPKEALEQVVSNVPGTDWNEVLQNLSQARETRELPPGVGPRTLLRLMELASSLHRQATALR